MLPKHLIWLCPYRIYLGTILPTHNNYDKVPLETEFVFGDIDSNNSIYYILYVIYIYNILYMLYIYIICNIYLYIMAT